MEYIRGDNLLKILEVNNNKPFAVDLVVGWAKQICNVLQHMHSQSPPVVHRDLKPDNIMLMEDGNTIKLIDFGTARHRPLAEDAPRRQDPRLHRRLRSAGTDHRQAGGASDLFALAGTMYHLVTGKSPEGFYTVARAGSHAQGRQRRHRPRAALVLSS